MEILTCYAKKFSSLRSDASRARWGVTTRYRAPHKPLLLLSIFDLFDEGLIEANLIRLTNDLGELFSLYWSTVMPADHRGNIILPFFHLRSDGFWHLVARPKYTRTVRESRQIRSITQFLQMVLGAKFDDELYDALQVRKIRDALRSVLIRTYFDEEAQRELLEQKKMNKESFDYAQILLEQARAGKIKDSGQHSGEYTRQGRDQGFRRAVVGAYNHRCAMCGIRMVTADGHTAVDAAHIVPWSVSQDDNPTNGMALCRLCHWTFDEGLSAVSSKYIVVISPQLSRRGNVCGHIVTLSERPIIGPDDKPLWPDLDALSWHRRHKFRTR